MQPNGWEMMNARPAEIEKKSFEILTRELEEQGIVLTGDTAPVIKRCIHTTADFDYARTMCFSENAVAGMKRLLLEGAQVVTDTNMALSGISRPALAEVRSAGLYSGGWTKERTRKVSDPAEGLYCFMADPEVAEEARRRGITRAAVSMERAMKLPEPVIFVIGNAPTALITLWEHYIKGNYRPAFIVGVPVGFVNVVAAKERIMETDIPYIVNAGRKGGSNVAAAICNAVLYQLREELRENKEGAGI